MGDITSAPGLYLGFAAMHLVLGQFASAWLYRARFGGSPLVLYRKGQRTGHMRVTRALSAPVLVWAAGLVAFALWPAFRQTWVGAALVDIPAWVGWALGGAGMVGMLGSQAAMGRAFRVGQDESPEAAPALVTSGPYRFSRNPVYLFSFLYLLGVSLWAPCALVLGACAVVGAMMHGLVLHEERFLRQRLGAPYEDYCRRVRRYL